MHGTTPLHAAIEITRHNPRGPHRAERVRELVARGADARARGTAFGVTPIVLAAIAGAPEVIPILAPVSGAPDLVTAAALADLDTVEHLIAADPGAARAADGSGWTPLLAAAASRLHREDLRAAAALPRIATLLLAKGADVSAAIDFGRGPWSVLAWAIGHSDNLPLARLLVEAGARIDDPAVLFEAAANQRYEALEHLISRGLDVNAPAADGTTVLHRLLSQPTSRGVEWLLAHGADPGIACGPGRETALHAAAREGCGVRVFRALIRHGADPAARNASGETPLALARRANRARLVALLREEGAPE